MRDELHKEFYRVTREQRYISDKRESMAALIWRNMNLRIALKAAQKEATAWQIAFWFALATALIFALFLVFN